MPNNLGRDDLIQMHQDLARRVTTLENSPQLGNVSIEAGALQILDPLGRLVMSLGYQPDGTIGLGLYDPASGARRILLGQVAGQEVLEFLDTSSRVVTSLGYQPDGLIGLANYDPASGTRETMVGEISASPAQYGLTVLNSAGTMQRVSGALSAFTAALQATSSTTGVTFGDEPTVTATVGPSGQALVSIGATVQTGLTGGGAAPDGDVILTVDGTVPRTGGGAALIHALDDSAWGGSVSATGIIGGLSAGSHVFSHLYTCTASGMTMGVSSRFTVVIPL